MLHEENGDMKEALAHLERSESQLVDKLHYHEKRSQLLIQLGQFAEAEHVYRTVLLRRNPEHYGYHAGLQAAVLRNSTVVERWVGADLPEGAEATLGALYVELQKELPRSTICRRIPLDFARTDDFFRQAATTYILP